MKKTYPLLRQTVCLRIKTTESNLIHAQLLHSSTACSKADAHKHIQINHRTNSTCCNTKTVYIMMFHQLQPLTEKTYHNRGRAGQIQPASSVDPACDVLRQQGGSSSVLTLNPAHVLPPNALRDEQLFSCQVGFDGLSHRHDGSPDHEVV